MTNDSERSIFGLANIACCFCSSFPLTTDYYCVVEQMNGMKQRTSAFLAKYTKYGPKKGGSGPISINLTTNVHFSVGIWHT